MRASMLCIILIPLLSFPTFANEKLSKLAFQLTKMVDMVYFCSDVGLQSEEDVLVANRMQKFFERNLIKDGLSEAELNQMIDKAIDAGTNSMGGLSPREQAVECRNNEKDFNKLKNRFRM